MMAKDLLGDLPEQPIPDGPPAVTAMVPPPNPDGPPAGFVTPPADITPVDQAGPGGILQLMQQAIASKDKDMLLTLEGMYDRDHARIAERAFLAARSKFQATCPLIPRRGVGMFKRNVVSASGAVTSKPALYATLPDLLAAVTEPLGANRLSLDFDRGDDSRGRDCAIAILSHALSHKERVYWPVFLNEANKQAMNFQDAAAVRYAQRYAAMSILGIPDDELDPENVNAPGETVEPGPPISRDCIDTIDDLLKQKGYRTDGERDKFFKWLTTKCRTPVTSTDTIPETQYDFCVNELNRMTDAT